MFKVVCIVGPTAVGKTGLALKISRHFKGALISADSVQVFKGLDIISGKDKDKFLDTTVYLLDIIFPTESFSVSQFERLGKKIIDKLNSEDKLPIVVGGTGLYVKSLIDGVDTASTKPDLKLRKNLESFELKVLQGMLRELDKKRFEKMNESDSKNKRRIIRAIEILKNSNLSRGGGNPSLNKFEFLQIGLELPREKLKRQIDRRVEERINNGAIKEARDLFGNYKKLTQQVKDANGYKQLFEHLMGNISLENSIEKWKISEYRHAKNQMTWFKKDKRIKWYRADSENIFEAVRDEIDTFLST